MKLKVKISKLKVESFFKRLFTVHCSLFILFLLFTVHYSLFTLSGCGYTLQGTATLPFTAVKIGRIENKTFEPKLEDKFQKALADELIRNGIMISKSATHVISGTINDFSLKPLSEKEGVASEYQVIIKARFFLTSPDGKVKELRNSGVFTVSFPGSGNIENIVAAKEQAAETAMRNLASEIRAGIVYSQ
ncbi:MAG: LPS assembly lipoprotein LptE [Thermodesulfovibrionales bacterium]|nr:LPS assembly lipoprotein LptE [Thermodesulfovibrionales bacterium]